MTTPARRTSLRSRITALIAALVTAAFAAVVGTSVASAETVPSPGASSSPTAAPTPSATSAPTDENLETGDVRGSVVIAASGAALPGVTVVAAPTQPGVRQETVTQANGAFHLQEVAPGEYTFTFSLTGFETVTRTARVRVGLTTTVDVEMSLTNVSLRLDRQTVTAGETLQLDAEGFLGNEQVEVELHSTPVSLGTLAADDAGALSGTIAVPSDTTPGSHEVVLIGESGRTASITVTVVAAPPLVATG